MAGISGQSTNESIRLAQSTWEAGADYGLLLPPNYWPKAVSTDIIADFYRKVADATPLPIVIYSFPAVCNGINMNSDLLAEQTEHPNIVGVKLTCGNTGKVTRLTNRYSHDQFAVYAGSSDWLIPCLSGGGSGCGVVAEAEKECKEGIASTKYAMEYFLGSKAGVSDERAFSPRKPSRRVGEEKRKWVVEAMGHLEVVEGGL
ncbi:dihydrodipicolinate synthase family protein [Aspergillus affinis]|uniref:dihydrodipicolinate synthase family protein n=1 Tax=Aspergillus affinis TaxID=1070780 RepID=UPI0022FECF17|nr:aldolase [Aspergillus affinis]KAI9043566.1 aldolase [Aspergillus affinis]